MTNKLAPVSFFLCFYFMSNFSKQARARSFASARMDFREKVKNVINKSKLIKAFSTRLKTQEDARKHPLTRSQSARLSSDRLPRRHRPAPSSSESSDWRKAVNAIHQGSVVQLRRVLQFNELTDPSHRFAVNGYDEFGRTLAIHFAQKCPR